MEAREPLLLSGSRLTGRGVETTLDAIEAGVRADVDALTERVLALPRPDAAAAWTDVWSDGGSQWRS